MIPQKLLTAIKPLVAKRVNEQFESNPEKIINKDYINLISNETLTKIISPQTVNSEIIKNLSVAQLQSLHHSILADYIINHLDLSKPLQEQQLSENLQYFIVPKAGDEERNKTIRALERSFLPRLQEKVNTEFSKNPNIRLDSSYIPYIKLSTLEKLNANQIINPSIISHLSQIELAALPPKMIAHYIITSADVVSRPDDQEIDMTTQIKLPTFDINTLTRLPSNIEKFLKNNRKKLTQPLVEEFNKESLEKLKEKVNAQVESSFHSFISVDYLNLLNTENMNNLAEYIVTQTNLEDPLDQQSFSGEIAGYKNNAQFWNIFKSKLSLEINNKFKTNPEMNLNVLYLDLLNSENLKVFNDLKEKTNLEFNNPTQPLSYPSYARHLSIETIRKLPAKTTLPRSTLENMTEQQLYAIPQEIFISSLVNILDLSKPFEQNFSSLINNILTNNAKLKEAFNTKRTEKINTEFQKNPTIKLDVSYIKDLNENTLQKINPTTQIQSTVIENLNKEQIDALPEEIIVRYIISKIDLSKNYSLASFSENISNYLTSHTPKINEKIEAALEEKVNNYVQDFLSKEIKENQKNKLINYDFLHYLNPENSKKLAANIADQIDITKSLFSQSKLIELSDYQNNKNFWDIFISKIKEKINRSFKENPNITMDYSYIKYISTGTIKNLNLKNRETINLNILHTMDSKQLKAFTPKTLQKIIDNPFISTRGQIIDTSTKNLLLSEIYKKFAKYADQLNPEQIKVLADMTQYINPKELQLMDKEQINALNMNDLSLIQFYSFFELYYRTFKNNYLNIILTVMKKINLMELLNNKENHPRLQTQINIYLEKFFKSLSPAELQELATKSIDSTVKELAKELLENHNLNIQEEEKITESIKTGTSKNS